ncbi:MAG: UDP-N-acetylmuramoyl-L-alanine--D-glutamate ligase [Desulfovibrionaceae bacterium]|nr:UDP-N-acetylmuramoyl-L-alanine--D-glutamate ligase [Desulfovibrionaceae bacterium]
MRLPLVSGMEAIVIGAGSSGISSSKLLRSRGFSVRLLEKNPQSIRKETLDMLEELGVIVLYGDLLPYHVEQVDIIVVSPGIPISSISSMVHSLPLQRYPYIIGEIELAYTFLGDEPIIAITGTAGKTTTVSLIAQMLEANNLRVFLGGNIGTPFSEYILAQEKADVIVLELSSFQLQGIHYFKPKVAGILNISENHLDYHSSMEEYVQAKLNIMKRQTKEDFLLLPHTLSMLEYTYSIPSIIRYIEEAPLVESRYLIGNHNMENIEFAYQASRIFGIDRAIVSDVASRFRSLPHRLEHVIKDKGVLYINDSKSTTVESLRVALQSMNAPTILLAGGQFKGGDLNSLQSELSTKVKHVILFGASKEIFISAWSDYVQITSCTTLQEAVYEAKRIAQSGDTILLSPATSSFDAFTSYQERGELFKQVVLESINE